MVVWEPLIPHSVESFRLIFQAWMAKGHRASPCACDRRASLLSAHPTVSVWALSIYFILPPVLSCLTWLPTQDISNKRTENFFLYGSAYTVLDKDWMFMSLSYGCPDTLQRTEDFSDSKHLSLHVNKRTKIHLQKVKILLLGFLKAGNWVYRFIRELL